MSRQDAVTLASRVLAVLLTLWVLIELSYLPGSVLSLLHYSGQEAVSATNVEYRQYWRHHYLIEFSFLITRIIGLSLMARWLHKGGPEINQLLLPTTTEETAAEN